MKTPLSSVLLVFGAAFIGSIGSVFLKSGAGLLHRQIRSLLTNWRLAIGVLLYVASSLLFIAGIREGELTILYPMVSLSYIFALLWSRLFFGEPLTRNKFVGLGLVVVGIVLLQLGNR